MATSRLDINSLAEQFLERKTGNLLSKLTESQAKTVRRLLRRLGWELTSSGSDRGVSWTIFRQPGVAGDDYAVEVSASYMGTYLQRHEYRVDASRSDLESRPVPAAADHLSITEAPGPITSSVYGIQDVTGFFEKAVADTEGGAQ